MEQPLVREEQDRGLVEAPGRCGKRAHGAMLAAGRCVRSPDPIAFILDHKGCWRAAQNGHEPISDYQPASIRVSTRVRRTRKLLDRELHHLDGDVRRSSVALVG